MVWSHEILRCHRRGPIGVTSCDKGPIAVTGCDKGSIPMTGRDKDSWYGHMKYS
jgi:hypothetical protein